MQATTTLIQMRSFRVQYRAVAVTPSSQDSKLYPQQIVKILRILQNERLFENSSSDRNPLLVLNVTLAALFGSRDNRIFSCHI